MSDLENKVKQVIAAQLQVNLSEISNNSSFIEDLGADSLDIVELVMAMEEHFNLEIPDEEAERIATVQDAINYISTHLLKSEA
jgi:acyl carrier protein